MKNIYAIRDDGVKYQQLDLELIDLFDLIPSGLSIEDVSEFPQKNTRLAGIWKTQETRFEPRAANPNGTIPDISCWIDATLVLSARAYNFLKDPLQKYGEFLKVKANGEIFHIFNCLEIGEVTQDSIVHEKSDDTILGVNSFDFAESVKDKLVFKTSVESCLTIYCNEIFKLFVEESGLSGLIFDQSLTVESPFE